VRVLVLGAILVAATGLFLLGSPGSSPSAASALFAHVAVGLLLLPVLLVFTVPHAVAQIRRKPVIGLTGTLVLLLALGAAYTGVTMLLDPVRGRQGGTTWLLHVVGGLGVFALYALHRRFGSNPARPAVLAAGVAAAVALAAGLLAWEQADPGRVSIFETGSAEAAEAARVHFFPSSATTGAGGLVPTSQDIKDVAACVRCHRVIADEWSRSAHRHASMSNPFYRASIEDLRKRFPKTDARWCGGCHDPALLFVQDKKGPGSQMVAEEIDFDAEDARVGITCVACHAIEPRTTNGNADYVLRGRQVYPGENSTDPAVREAHDVLLRLKPDAHVQSLRPHNISHSSFCSLCHKAEPPAELNRWKWIRAQDEYDAHDDSGVSMGNARSFYHPPVAKSCQDCHMPMVPDPEDPAADANGQVRSHLFATANTALPFLNGDADMIEKTTKFLQTSCRVDVTAILLSGERRFAPAWAAKPAVKPGEVVEAQVVVRNVGVGHRFPGGTVDSNEVWVEFEAAVGDSAAFYASGRIDPATGAVDPSAEHYRSFWLRRDGSRFVSRVANDLYTPIYVRRIGPGTADVVRYRFRVPEGAEGTLKLRATLRYRKFMLPFVQNVAKIRGGKDLVIKYRTDKAFLVPGEEIDVDLAKLPIVDMASGRLELPITREGTPGQPPPPETLKLSLPDDRDRLNDLAIAYLIQGDPDRAIEVFRTVTRVDPKYADGWVNVARGLIDRLLFDEALEPLREAQRLKPGFPKALFFEAEVWRRTARDYPRAEALYRRVLEAFPRDRESWKRLGEVLWQQDRFADGLATLEQYMKIEPEDSDAWFWVMRCYEGLGDAARAEQARTAHDKFRRDDEVTSRQGETLITDPDIHRLAQPIHVHVQEGLE
jgi:tetratricopeptide (TPR) repeat protein